MQYRRKLAIIQRDRHKVQRRLGWKAGNLSPAFPQRLKERRCASRCYLSGFCTVQLLDEVKERVSLSQKNKITAKAVSLF